MRTAPPTRARRTAVVLVALASLTTGCVKQTTKLDPLTNKPLVGEPRYVDVNEDKKAAGPIIPEGTSVRENAVDAAAPCDARLHEVSGLLLMYYALHKGLPPKLEDLAPLADPGQEASFTCPYASKPYVYVRQSLSLPTRQRQLVVYAPVAGRNGLRRAIVMSGPGGPQQAPSADVVQLTDERFQAYLKVTPPQTPPGNAAAAPVVPNTPQ